MSFLSTFLGMDASHNAGIQQQQANQAYGTLTNAGNQNIQAYNQVPGAINNIQQGVNNNPLLSLFQNGTTNSPLVQAFAQSYGLNAPGQHQAGAPGAAGGAPGQAPAPGGQGLLPQDAYGLSQPQQIELNTQLNQLDQSKQTALANYKSSFSQRGGGDPSAMAAGVAAIEEQFAAMSEQHKGAFADNANTQRQQGLQTLLSGGQAAETQQNAGNLSVADLLLSLGGAGANQIGTVAGAKQNSADANQASAQAAQSGLMQLGGTLAGIYA